MKQLCEMVKEVLMEGASLRREDDCSPGLR